ncbi:MAG: Asp-tRNA(Asn)/Glu-tRNA(Gln) amidotransferase subunit GatA [Candidatus Moranbacteria bacterium]|nr:Asp-tRNA(Asn)/Glu-tRNA(Gln) amidotransferase subunit GatA [Candidatus Moranbacteria bacterium]MDD3965387.1 Asp-tRNA(Asn)/Glu-tRNA(Gln) amidotransferase subunit GatA [Candidatus Moranbacteria bacterium]
MIRLLHNKLVAGEITAVDLAKQYLKIIKEKDGEILAYLTVLEEQMLKEASFVDEQLKRGETIDLLAGIPGAIKDNILIEGIRTTSASKILDNYIAPYDATVIAKLKSVHVSVLGKTNMDEFALGSSTENSAYQITKNPHDLTRVPGGTSGGSAAAVAAGEAVWALGSDTGGSIRQPASFCGVVGLKPTYGRVSRYGLMAGASSLDQIGPIGQTVEDVAIVLSRIAGHDPHDATTADSGHEKKYEDYLGGDVRGKKIGIPKEYFSSDLDPRIRALCDTAIKHFTALGVEIIEISLPHSSYALPTYYIIQPCEVSSNFARYDGIRYGLSINDEKDSAEQTSTLLETYLDTRRHGFGPEVKRRIMLGTYSLSAGYYDAYYLKAQKVRALLKQDFEKAFEQVDFIFSPTAPEPAFKIGDKSADPIKMYLGDIYTITANLTGVPAISFPIGTVTEEGKELPIGGQLQGKWFDEETLLCMADAFEKEYKKSK